MLDFKVWYNDAYILVICITAKEPVKGAAFGWLRK